jgi:hypothetical protein
VLPCAPMPFRVVVALALLSGCAPPYFEPLNPPPHPLAPKAASDVEILTISPGRPFVEIGDIQTDNGTPSREAITALAASHGCDAVVFPKDMGLPAACIVYTAK